MLASIQTLPDAMMPTALVVVKADMAEITNVPGLQRIHFGDDAVERRAYHGMVELALHLVDRRLGLEIGGRLRRRHGGVAVQLGELHVGVLLIENQGRLRALQCAARLIETGPARPRWSAPAPRSDCR